jgi:predicted dehydrogenase
MSRVRVGLVGIGKIARDQHIPVLLESGDFELVAAASRHSRVDGIANFTDVADMIGGIALDAVAICTPPQHHFEAARVCLQAGKHVLLEKPPCRSLSEMDILCALAARGERTLFQSWHSRFAPAVGLTREILRDRTLKSAAVVWKEDVRRWHPGQRWIWEAGGFGVFDPGINALSILTEILPEALSVSRSTLFVPSNCEAPIAAELTLQPESGAEIQAVFDFRHTGTQTWDITLETSRGRVDLSEGGSRLSVDGAPMPAPGGHHAHAEYAPLYERFAALIRERASEVDTRPFRLVADAFLIGRRVAVEAFEE